ncbi:MULTISPECIES: hypothetical protein [unclassified Lysobacter]|nr:MULTISPECIES: hypothetical protein [unclassified Lysobacter]
MLASPHALAAEPAAPVPAFAKVIDAEVPAIMKAAYIQGACKP